MIGLQSAIDRALLPRAPVNIWSLRKNPRIKSLLLVLDGLAGRARWCIDPVSVTSADAVYLCHPEERDLRAYLHVHGQPAGRAGLYLEYPAVDERGPTYETFEDLAVPKLADMLAAHFGILEPAAG